MDHLETPPRRQTRSARQRISNHFYSNNDRFVPLASDGFGTLASNSGGGNSNFDIGVFDPRIDVSEQEESSNGDFDIGVFDPRNDISEQEVIRRRMEEEEQRLREEEQSLREEEELVRKINDPKDWPELSPSPVKRVDKKKTDNRVPVIENGEDPMAGKSNSHVPEQQPSMKVNSKEWPSLAVQAPVDATESNDEGQRVNEAQIPPENNKSSEPTPTAKEESALPKRQQRLTSRCRRPSPPPQQLVANYEEHWARTSSLYDMDKERYQYIAQALMDLESNRAKIRDEYEYECEFPQYKNTTFTDSPTPNNPYNTPAATPERQTTTPPTYFQDPQLNTDVNNLADLLAQYSLKDLVANQELAESARLQGQYTPPESPEVQDDRDSYNRRYGHLFYRDGVPYKFFDAVHPDKKRERGYGGLRTQFGNRNAALNGFTVCPLEQTMGTKVTKEWGDEPTHYWNDLINRRRGNGNVGHAWGDYDANAPSRNRPGSDSPAVFDDCDHHLLGGNEF